MNEFFAMGGYAAFVWPCYAASALVIGLMIYFTLSAHARAKAELKILESQSGRGDA